MKSQSELSLQDLEHLESICLRHETGASDEDRDLVQLLQGIEGDKRDHFLRELMWHDLEWSKGQRQPFDRSKYQFDNPQDQHCADRVLDEFEKEQNANQSNDRNSSLEGLPQRYELIEEIGRGGIGSVYRVSDRHSQRPLAIKILQPRFRNDRPVNLRLEREAILTGSLQHPGIPPVHDHGKLSDDTAYFAMKLIEGQTLGDILQSKKTPTELPSAPELPSALVIFEKVSQAMAYAHSQGVIHRDLKPQNVMVGQFAEVQVMDWGMAKRIGQHAAIDSPNSSQTTAAVIPKPAGQAETVSNANDESATDARKNATENDSDKQVALTQLGDVMGTPNYMPPEQATGRVEEVNTASDVYSLGAILFEILTGRRIHDNQSTTKIIQCLTDGDLANSLAVLEESDAAIQLKRLCRRCLSFDVGKRPQHAGEVAEEMRQYFSNAEKRVQAAEIEKRQAEIRVLEESKRRRSQFRWMAAVIGVSILGLAAVCWQWANAKRQTKVAEKATSNYREGMGVFAKAFQSTKPAAGDRASMTAMEVLRQAEQSLAQSGLDDDGRMAMLRELSGCFRSVGDYKLAVSTGEESLKLHEANYGEEDPVTVEAMSNLALNYRLAGRLDDALKLSERTLKLSDASDEESQLNLLTTMNNLANNYYSVGRTDDSLALHERVLQLRTDKLGELDPATLTSMNNLSMVYQRTGRTEESLAMQEKVLAGRRATLGEDAPNTLLSQSNLASGYNRIGRFKEARAINEKVLAIRRKQLRAGHPDILLSMNNLALDISALGQFKEALELREQTLKLQLKELGEDHPRTLLLLGSIATNFEQLGRTSESMAMHQRILAIKKRKYGDEAPTTLRTQYNIAHCLRSANQMDKAISRFEQVLELQTAKLGTANSRTLQTMYSLANCYHQVDRLDDAKKLMQQCLFQRFKSQPESWRTFSTQSHYGGILLDLGEVDAAVDLLHQGYTDLQKSAETMPVYIRTSRLESALERLVKLATVQNDPSELAKWKSKLAELKN